MSQFCPEITQRGNFLSDPYFFEARATLEHLALEMEQSTNKQLVWPPPNANYFLSELCAWQQSSQNLNNAMVSTLGQELLNTVFRFENDHFKVIIIFLSTSIGSHICSCCTNYFCLCDSGQGPSVQSLKGHIYSQFRLQQIFIS